MLQFVLGRAGSGKTEYLRQLLARESLNGGRRLIMLVPEQYSFETEKAMLQLCGPMRANLIEVYSFTRLAEAVFRAEGGAAGRRLSDGGRRVLMSCALSACEDELELYKNAAQSGRVTDLMLTAVNEMKLCGISPQQLSETAAALSGRGLGKKLSEIALLYGAFEALVAASYLDSRDDLTRLAAALEESKFFRGCMVAVDSFEGFTAQELKVLTQMLRKADSVTVSLCTDGLEQGESGLFALVDRTRRRLTRAAEEIGCAVKPPVVLTGAPRFHNENLKLIEAQLFCAQETLTSPDHDGVELFEARDVYEEAEFAASTICRLIAEHGWRYRDFSIICRKPEQYFGSLDVALGKRGVPCFVSQPVQVDAEPVARFVLSAFEAALSGFATDDLLELLKTGVSGFSAQEISDLENYAFLWRLSGADWKEEWARHPRGFGQELTPQDEEELARLNLLRRRLMNPLLAFAAGTKDHTGAQISEAVFRLLEEFSLEETLPGYCEALEAAGDDALAARQVRVWELLMELLDQFHSILGDRKITRERYYRLLKEVLAAEDLSEIPQTVDEVLFGTAEQVRQSSPKAVFLLGASQGDFPLIPRSSGVFSDAERRTLIELQLPLGDPLEQKTIEERYLAYSVACGASERLYISWPRTVGGEEKEPSELVSGILSIFPAMKPLRDLPDEYFCSTREAAFSRMAARFTENSGEAGALRALFEGEEEYAGRIKALERVSGQRAARIEDPALSKRLFLGERPFLSPTQIETYHSCPFKYYCRYGLGAKERRPAEVDVMQYGTLMHYLFEKVFGAAGEDAGFAETELSERVRRLILQYADESMGGFTLLSGREQYRLERLAQAACKLILHIREELAQSKFSPKYFELHLGEDPDFPPLRIEDGAGNILTVGGTVDRADLYVDEQGREYVRVIDYKTGRKQFDLADVLYGLNMQMLIYLAALIESGRTLPAGILYVPAAEPSVTADRGDDAEKIKREADKQMRMNGLILSDDEIIRAMEEGAAGKFVPASIKKDGTLGRGSSVLSEEELREVLLHSKRLIATMGQKLSAGRVEADPAMVNRNACKFCPYGAVCGRELDDRDVVQDRASTAEILEQMEKGARE